MKIRMAILMGGGIFALFTGCVSKPMALGPVGPGVAGQTLPAVKGNLLVFSATEKGLPFASDDPASFNVHSAYDITDTAGNVQYVPNHASNLDEWPDVVTLFPGHYNLLARSSSCGLVSVPVVIEKGRTATVHLDGNWRPPGNTPSSQIVSLPDGSVVGWSGNVDPAK